MAVTPDNMKPVEIDANWLLEQVGEYILDIDRIEQGTSDDWEDGLNEDFYKAIVGLGKVLKEKNTQYNASWLKWFLLISLADLVDKSARFERATPKELVVGWDANKFRGTLFDILARTIMLLKLFDVNAENIAADHDD